MNPIIEQVLSGSLGMDVFLEELQRNQNLQDYIRSFVPEDAKADRSHAFWEVFPYSSLHRNAFDFFAFLFWVSRSNNKYGHYLNIYGTLKRAYRYYYPQAQCTSRYDDMFDIYLDAARDCFEGPEVLPVMERIIEEALPLSSKAKRSQYAKAAANTAFHAENRKRPRWIQGPEWPMGSCSPMEFVTQKKVGDAVHYEFRDVDTGNTRIIKQHY